MATSLMQRILANSPTKHTAKLSESVMFKDRDVIPTDVPIINVAFSGSLDGGISSGLTLFAGPSKSFKTCLSLLCAKAYMDKYKDAVCIYYDSEGGTTPAYLQSMGVDPNRVVHVPIEHLEMLKYDIVKQLKELNRGDKVIIIIDSIGNTASLKELEDALEEKSKAEMQRAKSIKGLFRMVTPSLVAKDIPCLTICHTYQEMALYPKQIISGGTGLIYSANTAFIIGKSQEKSGDELVGWNFTLNVEKSRFLREKSKLAFTVLYDGGVDKYSGLLELALELKFCSKPKNGWYQMVDQQTGELVGKMVREAQTGTEDFLGKILLDADFKEAVRKKFALDAGTYLSDEQIDAEMDDIGEEE
jgi:RecA/RadA recombinase